jgi:hypothetical protein
VNDSLFLVVPGPEHLRCEDGDLWHRPSRSKPTASLTRSARAKRNLLPHRPSLSRADEVRALRHAGRAIDRPRQ